jgi:hypothetical protein
MMKSSNTEVTSLPRSVSAAYSKPELTRYGNLAELTRTSSGNRSDNYQPNCNHADNGNPDPNVNCS